MHRRPSVDFPLAPRYAGEVHLVVDHDRRIAFASPSAQPTMGVEPEELVGVDLTEVVHLDDRDVLVHCWDAALLPDREARCTVRVRHHDGRWREAELELEPMDDTVVVRLFDVTARRDAERELALRTAQLRALTEHLGDVLLVIDDHFTLLRVGFNARNVFGWVPEELTGLPLVDLVHPADRFATLVDLEDLLAGRREEDPLLVRMRHGEGQWVPVEARIRDLRDNRLVGAIGVTIRDVSGRVVAERERDRLAAIVGATPDLVTMTDRHGRLLYANPAAVEFLDIEDQSQYLMNQALPDWVIERYVNEAIPALNSKGVWIGELIHLRDGEEVPLSCVLVAHRDEDGQIERVSAISRDISDRKVFEERLRHQATHDDLTGLPNRTLLLDRLEVALARTARLGTGVAVLFCDVDRFKVVNDSLGHALGDDLLKGVAARMARSLRPGDTVARFGGDEFVLLCSDLSSPRDAIVLAERVQAAVREPMALGGADLVTTLSVGVAYDESGSSQSHALLRDADAAMYRAKARGRDRVEVFDDALRHRALERLDTESGLRHAVDDERLLVHYQPVIDLRDDRVSGFEALMRWDHPDRGLLAPAEFLEVAEETGLIVPLGRWLFGEACRQTLLWQEQSGDDRLSVFVNFSARQLGHPTVVTDVAAVIDDTGIDPAHVQIEVTEHVLLDDEEQAVEQIGALKDLGLKIVIDDFGTGYASLSYLRRFPVDLLKVDRSFVSGLTRGEGDAAIVQGVIDIAHRLGLEAVAEGVESRQQLEALRSLGCERAQGYHLGRPGPAPEAQSAFLPAIRSS